MFHFIIITVFIIVNGISEVVTLENDLIKKCCAHGEYLNVSDWEKFECVEDKRKRLGIYTNYTNYLVDHKTGICTEITPDGFFRFEFKNGRISGDTTVVERYFPKCCPLGFNYDTKIHACRENFTIIEDYITETFIKVGLPQCQLIVDEKIVDVPSDLNPDDYNYCIDQDAIGNLIKRKCDEDLRGVCSNIRCVKKCCKDGKSFVNGSNCVDTHVHGLDLTIFDQIVSPSGK